VLRLAAAISAGAVPDARPGGGAGVLLQRRSRARGRRRLAHHVPDRRAGPLRAGERPGLPGVRRRSGAGLAVDRDGGATTAGVSKRRKTVAPRPEVIAIHTLEPSETS